MTLTSVTNALRVLRTLGGSQTVSNYAVTELLGVGSSTAHRLLTTLAAEGFLQRNPAKRSEYVAGPALLEIAAAHAGRGDIRQQARRPMERLAEQLGETVSLAVLEDSTTRVVDGVESRSTVRVGLRTGVVLPANATAAGKVLLADLSDEEVALLFPQGLPSLTPSTTSTWVALRAQLQDVRRQRFAFSSGESESGLHGLAVPVHDQRGTTIAALAIAAPHYRLPQRSVNTKVGVLHAAAEDIRRALSG